MQAFDSSYFRSKRYFEDYDTQNYFSQYIVILILVVLVISHNGSLKDSLMKFGSILPHCIIVLVQRYIGTKTRVKFSGICLKQDSH